MRQPGGRSFAFISGFMIGMLSALGIVFLLMNDLDPVEFRYRNPFTKEADTLVDRTEKRTPLLKASKSLAELVNTPIIADSLPDMKTDSISSHGLSLGTGEEVVVRRDEMILSRSIEANRITPKDGSKLRNDSLIRELAEAPPGDGARYRIEYWKSPVNFKGYRLIRNSLVLFGLNPEIPISLMQGNDFLILKYGNQSFRLIPNDSFVTLPKPSVE